MAFYSYIRELFAFALEQGHSPPLDDVFQQLHTAEQYQKQGQPDAAAAVLDRALAIYRNEEGTAAMAVAPPRLANTTRLLALSKFMELYAASGRAEQAVPLADELVVFTQSLPSQDDTSLRGLVGAANVYRTVKQNKQASSVLTYVIRGTEALKEPFVEAIILSEVTKVYANLNDPNRAAQVLLQAQELANAANGVSQKNAATVALVPAYLALGQHENASRIAETIKPFELRQQVQQAVSCTQVNPSR
jgi:tetratricopeptide (TPR) repeat protein